MDWGFVSGACDIVILIGALVLAFERIIKPLGFIKKKTDKSFEEKVGEAMAKALPDILKQHDKEIKDTLIKETTDTVMASIKSELTQVDLLKQQYEVLVLSAKDVLRAKIMAIYEANKKNKTMPLSNKEALEQYYIDYKALKGNSYIDKYYNRMKQWPVFDDEDAE